MTLPRFFVDDNIEPGNTFLLPEAAGHHLARVLRKTTADKVVVFKGKGGEFVCSIESISKNRVEVTPTDYSKANRAPDLKINLGLCVLKKDSMDSVLTKVTELGVARITPILSDHCAVAHKVIRRRKLHWRQVIVAACEQCGLNLLPVIEPAASLNDWITGSVADVRLLALPGGPPPMAQYGSAVSTVMLLTGPEGGFSETEEKAAIEAGFNTVTFGARILRAETAPVVGLSVIHQIWGEFSVTG